MKKKKEIYVKPQATVIAMMEETEMLTGTTTKLTGSELINAANQQIEKAPGTTTDDFMGDASNAGFAKSNDFFFEYE